MEENKKIRLSGIELLKILALIMIMFSHTMPIYGDGAADSFIDISLASANVQVAVLSFFKYFGQIGNAIFIVCSAYFLVDSKTVKGQKILYIVLDAFAISVVFLCGFLAAGYKLSAGTILLQFIPVTSRFNWFIGCYLIMYAAHPLLNKIIHGTGKRNLLIFNIFIFILYSVLEFVGGELINMYYYTHLVGFFCLYMFVGYAKVHMQNFLNRTKLQAVILAVCFACLVGLFALTEFLGSKIGLLSDKMNHWDEINNPFMIGIGISSFALFSKLKFRSRFVNYLSSLSLAVYMIHENKLFRDLVRPQIFEWVYQNFSYQYIVGWCVLLVIATFVASCALAALYKHSLGWLLRKAVDKCYPKIAAAGNRLWDRLESKD